MKTDDKGVRERFAQRFCSLYDVKVYSSIDGKLLMGERDADKVIAFIEEEVAQAERRGMDMVLGATYGTVELMSRHRFSNTDRHDVIHWHHVRKLVSDLKTRFNGPQDKGEVLPG